MMVGIALFVCLAIRAEKREELDQFGYANPRNGCALLRAGCVSQRRDWLTDIVTWCSGLDNRAGSISSISRCLGYVCLSPDSDRIAGVTAALFRAMTGREQLQQILGNSIGKRRFSYSD